MLTAASCSATTLLLILLSPLLAAAIPASYFINHTDHCFASTKPAATPAPLEFCYWYNDKSCCQPGADLKSREEFMDFIDVGAGCSPSDHFVRATYHEVKQFACLPCSPEEPSFRYRTRYGDGSPDPNRQPDASFAEDHFTWRICASFVWGGLDVNESRGLWGGNGAKYDRCGVMLQNDCLARKQVGYDSVTNSFVASTEPVANDYNEVDCGLHFAVPSTEYGSTTANKYDAALAFMEVLPSWMDDFNFIVVNDSDPLFNRTATPCFAAAGALSPLLAAVVAVASVMVTLVL